ncbi:MAG: hypothetical protein GY810_23095 [Aureispira sp.]|nr:hypothetical protein [Aureispira sp.]
MKNKFLTVLSLLFYATTSFAQYNWEFKVNKLDSNKISVYLKCYFENEDAILARDTLNFPFIIGAKTIGFLKGPKMNDWKEIIPPVYIDSSSSYLVYKDSLAFSGVFELDTTQNSSMLHVQFLGFGAQSSSELYRIDEVNACLYYIINDNEEFEKIRADETTLVECQVIKE